MSLRYIHTLIPTSPEFIPSATQVQAFLASMRACGAIGEVDATLKLRTPSDRFRTATNPFTGKTKKYRMSDHASRAGVSEAGRTIAALDEYAVELAGIGRPNTPPVPLDFEDPYHIAVTCRRTSKLCSTSDLHEESGSSIDLPFYGNPCNGTPREGYFSNPHTLDVIEVPNAGCARFWIEFHLGNGLFPSVDQNNLKLLNPTIVAEGERIFETSFAQGCQWG